MEKRVKCKETEWGGDASRANGWEAGAAPCVGGGGTAMVADSLRVPWRQQRVEAAEAAE